MDNEAFHVLGLTIYWYGILTAVGFMLGFGTASRRAPLTNISGDAVLNLAPWIILGAVLGARIFYVVTYWDDEFAGKPIWDALKLGRSGLVYYGGLVGASIATVLYCRFAKLPLMRMADILAPSVALGHAFGRIGCLMTGCCYGRACDLPWAITFPTGHATHGVPVHPAQVYESLANLGLYLGLALLYRRKKFDGQVWAVYLLAYAVVRSTVETFRGDYAPKYIVMGMSPGQLTSLLIVAAGVGFWATCSAKSKTSSPAPTRDE